MTLGAALLYFIMRKPSSIFVVGAIVVGWVQATSPKPLILNGRRIKRKERFLGVSILSTLILVLSGVLHSFLNSMGVGLTLIMTHMCLRHTNIRSKAGAIRTQMADLW